MDGHCFRMCNCYRDWELVLLLVLFVCWLSQLKNFEENFAKKWKSWQWKSWHLAFLFNTLNIIFVRYMLLSQQYKSETTNKSNTKKMHCNFQFFLSYLFSNDINIIYAVIWFFFIIGPTDLVGQKYYQNNIYFFF